MGGNDYVASEDSPSLTCKTACPLPITLTPPVLSCKALVDPYSIAVSVKATGAAGTPFGFSVTIKDSAGKDLGTANFTKPEHVLVTGASVAVTFGLTQGCGKLCDAAFPCCKGFT